MAAAACGFEHAPRPLDVALERGQRTAVGDADNRLCRQVENGLDLVLGERALEQWLILGGAADDVDAGEETGPGQLGAAHLITHQTDDVSTALDEGLCGPGADEAGAAGDEDTAGAPEGFPDVHRPPLSLKRSNRRQPPCLPPSPPRGEGRRKTQAAERYTARASTASHGASPLSQRWFRYW